MFTKELALPSLEELKQKLPLTEAQKEQRALCIKQIKEVLSGKSKRFLMIVGPCSAHDPSAVLEFVSRLATLNGKVKEKLVLIPRIFTEKPRTRGVGYKGLLSHPDPEQDENYPNGIYLARKLHLQAFSESGLVAADEMLVPEGYEYISDIVGYTVIGARTSESALHRTVASGLDTPTGIKNPMSGSIPALVNSVFAVQQKQRFLHCGYQVRTDGNEYAHAILRGRVNEYGKESQNYDGETVERLNEAFAAACVKNPAFIVDCNHANTSKQFFRQPVIAKNTLKLCKGEFYGKHFKGFMLESFLEEGASPQGGVYGQSITDPCLGWADTERLILEIADKL